MLGAVDVEDLVIEEDAPPPEPRRQARLGSLFGQEVPAGGRLAVAGEDREDGVHVVEGRRLVERDADAPALLPAQVDAPGLGSRQDPRRLLVIGLHREGVEDRRAARGTAKPGQPVAERQGEGAHPAGDPEESLRPVPGGVGRGDQRGEHLRRADVAGGAVPPDVLLAGLEGEAEADPPGGVVGDAHHASGGAPGVRRGGGEERGVGSAAAHRHAEALRGADRDVGAEGPRRLEHGQRQQVGGDHRAGPRLPDLLRERPPFADPAPGIRVLDDDPRDLFRDLHLGIAQVPDLEADARRAGAGLHHRERLRMEPAVGEEGRPALAGAVAHRHRLGRRRGLVEQRGARDRQAGQVPDHGLEVEQDLEPALRDLRLVRACTGCTSPGPRGCSGG